MASLPPLLWHRQQAITLASQLPDHPEDAMAVVAALQELVETFLVCGSSGLDEGKVVPIGGKRG